MRQIYHPVLLSNYALSVPDLKHRELINTETLRVNKQVYAEARGVLLKDNIFVLEERYETITRGDTLRWARKFKARVEQDGNHQLGRGSTVLAFIKGTDDPVHEARTFGPPAYGVEDALRL